MSGSVLGARFRAAREAAGLTQKAVGESVGRSKQWVSEFERGHIGLDYDMAVRLAGMVEQTPDRLFLAPESKSGIPIETGDAA